MSVSARAALVVGGPSLTEVNNMVLADWIVLGGIVLFAALGIIAGFGGALKFFTSGIFGVVISVVVCYFLYGIVVNWQITQDLLQKFIGVLQNADNGFCNFLVKIHVETIVTVVVMFLIIQIVRIIIVQIIKHIAEINNGVIKAINKTLGLVIMLAVGVMLLLIVFQIVNWIGGATADNFAADLDGSLLKLDKVFERNPLNSMIEFFTAK